MLKPRWRKVLRDVWLHKSRSVLVVLAIAVGIIGAGSVLNTWSLVRRATRDEYRVSNPASATLRTDAIDAALLQRVRQHPAVLDAQARRTVVASARVPSGVHTAVLFAVDDFRDIRIGRVKAEAGAWPPNERAMVLEASSVDFAGLGVGDSLAVQLGDGPAVWLPVTGVARDVGLAPGWMEHIVYGFVTRTTLAQLGAPATLSELQIVVDRSLDRAGVRSAAYDIKALVEQSGRTVSDVEVPVPGRHIHAAQIDSLLFTQAAFGVLAMLLSCILVVNLITAMLAGQVREIGVMKAVGARGGQIAQMYLAVALIFGVVASAIALPLASVIGRAYAQFTADLLNFSIDGFAIPAGMILLQATVGVLMPVAAAAIPVLRGSRLSVSDALRDFGIDLQRGSVRRRGSRLSLGLTRPLLLSLRNAFRKRQRMTLTLVTLAVGGAVYIGALNLRASIIGSVDLLFAPQRYDIVLRTAAPWPADTLEAVVRAIPGVAAAEAWSSGRGAIQHADGSLGSSGGRHGGNTFPLTAPPVPSRLFVPTVESGRWLRDGDDRALVVNRRLLEEAPDLTVGDSLLLLIAGQPIRWSVVGIAETGPSIAAYVPREALAALLAEGRVNSVAVAAAKTGEPEVELAQRLRTELEQRGVAVHSTQLVQQSRRVTEDHLLMVAGFLGIMGQLMIIVGGLGLASTMSVAVLERTREIGVLRAIGAKHRSILTMVQVEGLVIAAISWLLAIPLSVPMSVVLGNAFGKIMIRVPVTYLPEPGAVVRWLGVALAVSVVACLWPAWRAMRIPTAAALAYE